MNDLIRYDEDGFQVLIRKSPADKAKAEKKALKEKEKKERKLFKNPFKKGSWKFDFFKRAKNYRTSANVQDFHFTKCDNLVVYRRDDPKTIISKSRFNLKELEKIADKYSDSFVLVNAYLNTFLKISVKSYLKLMKVKKIVIEYVVQVQEDGYEEYGFEDFYEATQVIDNINELMSFINYYRNLIHGVGEVQARVCNYTWVNFKVKTLIIKQDGDTKTFKGDFNEVMEYLGIKPLL